MSTILEKACGTLWAGSDLDEAALFAALARAGSRGVDWADLYFQHIESHDWLLEEGIVKTGHFSIDRGYGLRTIAGERQALSYGDDLVSRNLLASADDLRSLCGPRSVTMPAHFRPQAVRPLYSPNVEAIRPGRSNFFATSTAMRGASLLRCETSRRRFRPKSRRCSSPISKEDSRRTFGRRSISRSTSSPNKTGAQNRERAAGVVAAESNTSRGIASKPGAKKPSAKRSCRPKRAPRPRA